MHNADINRKHHEKQSDRNEATKIVISKEYKSKGCVHNCREVGTKWASACAWKGGLTTDIKHEI